jgi:hypothetical protein
MDANQRRLDVMMPKPDQDRPSWGRVGVIAAVGFVIGIAWPRIAGVKLGPSAPGESDKSQPAASASGPSGGAPPAANLSAPSGASGAKNAAIAPSAAPSASAVALAVPPEVTVARGIVLNCKTSDGESQKGAECGKTPNFDVIAQNRLQHLAQCSAAAGVTGKLSTVFSLDFGSGRVGIDIGKSSTIGSQDGIASCLKTEFYGVNIAGITHEHPKYTMAYHVTFAPAKEGGSAAAPDATPPAAISEGAPTAQVGWEVALVRDTPKTGSIVARLPRGSKVRIGAPKDGWYRIQYGNAFASEGWVYRGAIGK